MAAAGIGSQAICCVDEPLAVAKIACLLGGHIEPAEHSGRGSGGVDECRICQRVDRGGSVDVEIGPMRVRRAP